MIRGARLTEVYAVLGHWPFVGTTVIGPVVGEGVTGVAVVGEGVTGATVVGDGMTGAAVVGAEVVGRGPSPKHN